MCNMTIQFKIPSEHVELSIINNDGMGFLKALSLLKNLRTEGVNNIIEILK